MPASGHQRHRTDRCPRRRGTAAIGTIAAINPTIQQTRNIGMADGRRFGQITRLFRFGEADFPALTSIH